MLLGILWHDHIQWHPQLIRHYTNLRTYYRTGLYYRFWPYCQILEVSIKHCNGCGKPTEDAYSSGHLVLSHLGLAFILMLRPFFPEFVMSTDLLSFEHPSVLLFCFALTLSNLWCYNWYYIKSKINKNYKNWLWAGFVYFFAKINAEIQTKNICSFNCFNNSNIKIAKEDFHQLTQAVPWK